MGTNGSTRNSGPGIILYCVDPPAYRLLRAWAALHAYTFRLIVTTPGPTRARNIRYREIVAEAPPDQDILVTTGMRRIAPLIASLEPDLILSFTLPYRIPPEITALPRHGAVNLHPAPLPAYRGPNPARMIYDGAPMLGATLHRTAADYDTGAILSLQTAPLPADVSSASVLPVWNELLMKALNEGVARALADDPGMVQDSSQASYAASFTPEEMWLDWSRSSAVLQRQTTALNLTEPCAKGWIEGTAYRIQQLTCHAGPVHEVPPGMVLERAGNIITLQTADSPVRLTVEALANT